MSRDIKASTHYMQFALSSLLVLFGVLAFVENSKAIGINTIQRSAVATTTYETTAYSAGGWCRYADGGSTDWGLNIFTGINNYTADANGYFYHEFDGAVISDQDVNCETQSATFGVPATIPNQLNHSGYKLFFIMNNDNLTGADVALTSFWLDSTGALYGSSTPKSYREIYTIGTVDYALAQAGTFAASNSIDSGLFRGFTRNAGGFVDSDLYAVFYTSTNLFDEINSVTDMIELLNGTFNPDFVQILDNYIYIREPAANATTTSPIFPFIEYQIDSEDYEDISNWTIHFSILPIGTEDNIFDLRSTTTQLIAFVEDDFLIQDQIIEWAISGIPLGNGLYVMNAYILDENGNIPNPIFQTSQTLKIGTFGLTVADTLRRIEAEEYAAEMCRVDVSEWYDVGALSQLGLCKTFVFLFVPSNDAIVDLVEIPKIVMNKVPFSLITDGVDVINEFMGTATGTASTTVYLTAHNKSYEFNIFPFASSSAMYPEATNWFKDFLTQILWLTNSIILLIAIFKFANR